MHGLNLKCCVLKIIPISLRKQIQESKKRQLLQSPTETKSVSSPDVKGLEVRPRTSSSLNENPTNFQRSSSSGKIIKGTHLAESLKENGQTSLNHPNDVVA